MADSVRALFSGHEQVDNVIGALRTDGVDSSQISVTAPDGTVSETEAAEHHGFGANLLEHLRRHNHAAEQAQPTPDHTPAAGWLVSVTVRSEAEDRSARNLFIRAGATAISSATDGHMVPISQTGPA
jgi:hypothetical protein